MAKPAVNYACTDCGYTAGRWFGKCPGCNAFGTLGEDVVGGPTAKAPPQPILRLVDVEATQAARITTGVPELDRVLGGGLVPASLVLVGGEPGVGKSTLLLSALAAISKERRALLVTGEESVAQVKLRAERLGGGEDVEILAETELETVCATLEAERPDVCVIDSVQTLYSAEVGSAPGSVAQVREAAARLLRAAKELGVATILVGHVTKDGAVAGPRVLEHLVDCVLQFEGDRYRAHRVLRAVKNRFGSTNEIGVFEMTGAGLVGVPDPSEVFGRTVDGEAGAPAGAAPCAPARRPSARSASPDGCARRRRATAGWRNARSSGSRRCWRRAERRRVARSGSSRSRRCATRSELDWMPSEPKEPTRPERLSSELGFTRTPSEDDPRRDPHLLAAIEKIAPGTPLRQAVDDVIRSHEGALIVLGGPQELSFLYSGGIRLDAPFRPQLLYDLAKMDGAIIVDTAVKRLAWANVQLMPDPTIPSDETGTRHPTADRVAKQTGALVISVSQPRETVTIFVGPARYQLDPVAD